MAGAILFFVVVSAGGWYVKSYVFGRKAKRKASYASLGLSAKAPDGDAPQTDAQSPLTTCAEITQ